MPEVSVIVPIYKVENKIKRCIDSLLEQSFVDFELILVDDGSPDKSAEICDRYAEIDSRIRVIHQQNGGVSKARNHGLESATGKYVTFVDSDDYVEVDYLKVLYDAIQNEVDISICGIYYCNDQNSDKLEQKRYVDTIISINDEHTEYIADLLINRRFNYVYGKMYRNDVIQRYSVRFKEEISLGEDTIFVFDYLTHASKIAIVENAYYNYIKYSEGTLTSKFCRDIFNRYMYISRYIVRFFENQKIMDEYILTAIDLRILQSLKWALESIWTSEVLLYKEKSCLINKMLRTPEVLEALSRNNCRELEWMEIKLICNKSANLLLLYYWGKEFWQKRIKTFVVKVVPSKWIKRGKKCVSNVQLLFQHIMRKKR